MKNHSQKYLLFIALFAALMLSGCATRGEIKKFKQQLDYLESASKQQQVQIELIDSVLIAQQEKLREINAAQQSNTDQLQSEIRIVEAILKESGYQVSTLSKKVDNMRQEVAMSQPGQKTDSTDSAAKALPTNVNPKQLFETASLDFNKGKYDLAKMEFEQFIELFPNSALADDAQYQIGECIYAQGKYDTAKRQYLSLEAKYPSSGMIPTALYRAAVCCEKMDDIKGAIELHQKIVDKYPQSQEAPLSSDKLLKFGH